MSEGGDNSVVSLSEKLRQVASQGQFDLVRDLVKTGVQFSTDQEGRTALHYAALNGHVDICKFLLQQGCNIDDRDVLGYTPLHRAASKGHTEVIDLLLVTKCNLDFQDEHGNGAIHEAAWNGFSQTLELLIKHHCNIILTNKSGFTALHLASQNGHNQSARVLLYGGCNADLKNNYGDTALHTAARYGHAGVTRILISARCRLDEQNKNGDTALHISAALRRKKIAKLVVEAGIDVNIVNKQDETAIDVARRKDHPEVIITITSLLKTKAQVHPSPKVVNFSEIPVDIDGPMVVPDEDMPVKTEKSEKGSKFFSFLKKKKKDKDKSTGSQVHPTPDKQTVQGFFSQYIPKTGQQYYRDLAGNIKQGPVGYTPICQCMPALQQLEKRVDKDKEHIYEHIDASHQILKNRMDQLDKRTSQQLASFDGWSRDRFDEEERNCYGRIDQRMADHHHYMANHKRGGMDVDNWLEAKLSEYGHCLDHHHDDSALPSNNIFTDIHETENGRLFRSRSDETLSQSDNHSGKFRKRQFYESRQQAMQQIRAWQVPAYGKDRSNRNPVLGRRDTHGIQNQQAFNRNTNQQSLRQNITSPNTSQQNPRSLSRPEFISPSTNSTSRSPYLSHDPVYGSQYGGYDQGAIPKRLPTSQTWHGANELQAACQKDTNTLNHNSAHELKTSAHRESSPLTHSTPKSRESSPYDYSYLPPKRTMKSRLESDNIPQQQSDSRNMYRNIQSENRNIQSEFKSKSENRNIQSEFKSKSETRNPNSENRNAQHETRFKSESRNYQSESRNIYSDKDFYQQRHVDTENLGQETFGRQSEVRRSNIESRNLEKRQSETRRSFPERGSSNTSTGTNLTSNSSSTGQGPLTESNAGKSLKPTFTTFGYPEKEQKSFKSAENSVVQNSNAIISNNVSKAIPNSVSNSVHQSESTYGYYGNRFQTSKQDNALRSQNGRQLHNGGINYNLTRDQHYDPHSVNNTHNSAVSSINNRNRDDMYLSSNHNFKMPRQRSMSSEGILLDDELISAHQMKLRRNDQTTAQRSATPNSPRSGQGQSYNVHLETIKRSAPEYGSARSYSREHIDNSRAIPSERNVQNSQYYNNPKGNISTSTGQIYSSARDVPFSQYSGGQVSYNRDRPNLASDSSSRESPYGALRNYSRTNDVRNQTPSRQGHSYSTYTVNSNTNSVYGDYTHVPKISSKSESQLDKPSHEGDQSLLQNRNLQSTPIQDKSKEDNSSNPDSGYSSKIFGRHINSVNGPNTSDTPSSSFSTEPTDHNLTLSSNNSPHPQVNHSDYAQISTVGQQYQKELSNHVQQWYQRKLIDAANHLNEDQYGHHGEYHSQSQKPPNDYSSYEYVQPSQQISYHGNQMYSSYKQVPNYIRGSDV